MDNNIVFYIILAIALFFSVRKYLRIRSVKNYSAAEVAAKIKNNANAILLDVRTAQEHSSSSIKNSLHIPLQELSARMDELQKYNIKEIICYCQSGSRSLIAAAKLHQSGFDAAHMKGGIGAWNFHHLK
jgi:rhodanese-related sulfurtransferase